MDKQTVYVVQEIGWGYHDEWFFRAGEQPIKAFTRREAAEAYWQEKERMAREAIMNTSPWDRGNSHWSCNIVATFGNLPTSLTAKEFASKAREIGLPPVPYVFEEGSVEDALWSDEWWVTAWKTLRPDRTDLLWSLLDCLNFYEVIEMEVQR